MSEQFNYFSLNLLTVGFYFVFPLSFCISAKYRANLYATVNMYPLTQSAYAGKETSVLKNWLE